MQYINTWSENNKVGAYYTKKRKKKLSTILYEQKYLLVMSIPFVIWLVIFKYIPLWGWTMAFQNFQLQKSFFEQEWVGFKHFITFLKDPDFYRIMRNTLGMSLLDLIIGFPIPIIFALLLNEIKNEHFKRTVQTVSYLPHFVSWVVVASIISKILSPQGGAVNELLMALGIIKRPIQFLAIPQLFWWIVTFATIWKEMGWNSIIYLAAISGIDPQLYESAEIDGAGRIRKMWHVTLPGIRATIVMLLILRLGHLINIGFERQMLLGNSLVKDYADVLDLYVLQYGIQMARFSYGTAVGIFKSVVSIIMLFSANYFSKKLGESGVF